MPRTRSRGPICPPDDRSAPDPRPSKPKRRRKLPQTAHSAADPTRAADTQPPSEILVSVDDNIADPLTILGTWPYPISGGTGPSSDTDDPRIVLRADIQPADDERRLLSITAPSSGHSSQAPLPRPLVNGILRLAAKRILFPRLQPSPEPHFIFVLAETTSPSYKLTTKSLIPILTAGHSPDLILLPQAPQPRTLDSAWLYNLVARLPSDADCPAQLPLPVIDKLGATLKPEPRPYQKRALAWMLDRERDPELLPDSKQKRTDNPFWRKLLPDPLNQPNGYYFHSYTGTVSLNPPTDPPPDPANITGGVLADEMGVGKTIEVMALILANPRPDDQLQPAILPSPNSTGICPICEETDHPFAELAECVECAQQEHPACSGLAFSEDSFFCAACKEHQENGYQVPAKATLIVVPSTLLSQWRDEILRHIHPSASQLIVYTGVRDQGYLSARIMAAADIVLTSYEVLRADLYRVQDPEGNRKLRYVKLHHTVPTPLVFVGWWRVCLDEAQMVENGVSGAAQFADRLTSSIRWAVTGTPVRSRVDELWGLMKFLRVQPFTDQGVWERALLRPAEKSADNGPEEVLLKNMLRAIIWRTRKRDVPEELGIPKQTVQVKTLTFGPIEAHFYRGQHDSCNAVAQELLRRLRGRGTAKNSGQLPLTTKNAKKLLSRLVSLRQACCHPQIGVGGLRTLQKTAGLAMTMSQVLAALLQKAKMECEEALRLLCVARNAIAGLHLISLPRDVAAAVAIYRGNLALVEKYKGRARLDKLQLLHTYYNLDQVLSWPSSSAVGRALSDESLPFMYNELRRELVQEAKLYRDQAIYAYQKARTDFEEAEKTNFEQEMAWWNVTLGDLRRTRDGDELVDRVIARAEEARNVGRYRTIFQDVIDIDGILTVVDEQLSVRVSKRKKVLSLIESLPGYGEPRGPEEISLAGNCGKCRFEQNCSDVICTHCEAQPEFDAYEQCLFFVRVRAGVGDRKEGKRVEGARDGNKAHEGAGGVSMTSEVDTLLKDLQTVCQRRGSIDAGTKENAKKWAVSLEHQKREFRQLQGLWSAEKDYLAKLDEMSMSVLRFSIRESSEAVNELEQIHRMLQGEVGVRMAEWESSEKSAEWELSRRNGQCVYLESLERQSSVPVGGRVEQNCPMCTCELKEVDVTVFPCGHSYCFECTAMLIERIPKCVQTKRLLCPVCRASTFVSEISYVSSGHTGADGEAATEGGKCDQDEDEKGGENKYGTKIGAVTETIVRLSRDDPSAKVLVFSQWTDMLQIVGESLCERGVRCVRLDGGGAKKRDAMLEQFKKDGRETVLLLPFRSGANGLNLVEARYVVLVEPLLNSAAEQQAIGRVDRIGQRHETTVYRFIVERTIEEKMVTVCESEWGDGGSGAGAGAEAGGGERGSGVETIRLKHVAGLFDDSVSG